MTQEDRDTRAPHRPVILCILDGWGLRDETAGNAIRLAATPHWDRLRREGARCRLDASGGDVGLPDGQMGNSEVGHMTIGAGRTVCQDLPRINRAIAEGTLATIPALLDFIAALKTSGGTCHLLGLMSPGGVHSHQDHIAALARAVADAGVAVHVHALLDGRDTPPRSARDYLRAFEAATADQTAIGVSTLCGRYYALDRDTRWDRVARAYATIAEGAGERFASADAVLAASYDDDIGDEFVVPAVVGDFAGMADGDGLIMANFRADRAREILTALVVPTFDGFDRARPPTFASRVGMVDYSAALAPYFTPLFPPVEINDGLGETVARAGLTQARIAETEKYAHVTFFFNGGREAEFAGETRILVPSPKVATYDLMPEMAADAVTDKVVAVIRDRAADLIIVNFANTDMVGHSGKLDATIAAVEAVDRCLGRIADAVDATDNGVLLVTSDHGNAEQMADPESGQPHTAHTTNPVPLVFHGRGAVTLKDGGLSDIAPTVLALLGLDVPAAMTGRNLIAPVASREAADKNARAAV